MSLKNKINRALELCENFFSINWLNPFATIYLNLRCLPLRQAVKMPVWVFGRPRLMNLSGTIKIEGTLRSGMVWFNRVLVGSPSNAGTQSELNISGTVIFHGTARIRTGCRIVVDNGGVLEIGDGFILADYINIGCAKSIRIGNYTRIAHRSQIFDTNYHYTVNFNKGIIPPLSRPIVIGDHCWICNSSTISAGAVVPSDSIVSSNSLVNKDFSALPPYSIIGGCPAKHLASGIRMVNKLSRERNITEFYNTHPGEIMQVPESFVENDWFDV